MLLRPGLRATLKFPTLSITSTSASVYTTLPQSILRQRLSTCSPLRSPRTHGYTNSHTHARTLPAGSGTSRPRIIATTLLVSSGVLVPQYLFGHVTRNDVAPYSHGRDAKTPLSSDGGRSLNPAAIRQISTGAILGLGLGVVMSALSKMLVLVLGVGIVVWQYAARRGYNFIPVDRLQRYVKGVNLRSAINDNAAFKISFGLMFALTAFGEF